jgi:hypothetical protein
MLKNMKYILIAALLCLATANAATLAVLEITVANDEMNLTIDETKFLTDELRRQAAQLLPKEHSVLTREKIISLAPKTGENLTSAIDIGTAIKSDYVTRSFIGKLGSLFTLTVELYETASGDLLGDFVKESADLKGLLDAIRENSPNLFAKITQREKLNRGRISANVPGKQKESKASFWVAVGLDALGAAAIGLGIYNNSKASDYYKESQNLLKNDLPAKQEQYQGKKDSFEARYKKMQSAETARNIFYATGGALLLGGVAVHIWF